MLPALPWLIVGSLESVSAAWLGGWPAPVLGWVGSTTIFAGVAYLARQPRWLGKGTPWAWVMLPVLLFARGVAASAQRLGLRERVEITPGLWVGGWPRNGAPELAQLDLTAELPRRGTALRYANVPMLDGAAPEPEAWARAVDVALGWRREGLPVLIHCAYGHGRSVAVLIGVMVADGIAPDFEAAHALVLRVRPRATMTPAQRARVKALLAERR